MPSPPKQASPADTHTSAHMVLNHRSSPYAPMSPRTKSAIKWIRRVQLALRVVQLNAAIGILVIMVLLDKINTVKGWVMRIAPGVVILHCLYAIYHLSREATGRTPSSSAAYQVFSVFEDLAALGLYAFSAFTTHNESKGWTTRLSGREDLTEIFVPAVYYALVAAGALHVLTLVFSLWLAWAFHRISMMPPDMNPLEDNLTARPKHKRNKSSLTTLTATDSNDRLSTPHNKRPDSEMSFQNMSPRRSVPFMHTRQGSSISINSRDSKGNLPDRRYQIIPGNTPRNSAVLVEPKRMSRPMSAVHGTYAELPLNDPNSLAREMHHRDSVDSGRVAKFTEAWAPTDSLVSRTNERNRQAAAASRQSDRNSAAYAALTQRYNGDDSSDSEYEDENDQIREDGDLSQSRHPNPLGSNPLGHLRALTDRMQTPFYAHSQSSNGNAMSGETLNEMSPNRRRVSNSKDITDLPTTTTHSPGKPWSRNRDSSIQPDSGFYSKPYGELKSATPPIMIENDRKISSGNDFRTNKYSHVAYERRNVSGKVAEEGRAGNRTSQYGFYSDRNL